MSLWSGILVSSSPLSTKGKKVDRCLKKKRQDISLTKKLKRKVLMSVLLAQKSFCWKETVPRRGVRYLTSNALCLSSRGMQLEFSVILCNFHIVRKPSTELLRNKEKQMSLLTNHRGNAKVIAIFVLSHAKRHVTSRLRKVSFTRSHFLSHNV